MSVTEVDFTVYFIIMLIEAFFTDLDDDSPAERAQRMITPEVRGILKSGSTVVPTKPKTLAKGESSEVRKVSSLFLLFVYSQTWLNLSKMISLSRLLQIQFQKDSKPL